MKDVSFQSISNKICTILDYLNIKQAHFIGLSLGTMVIHDIMLTHEERVKSVIQMGAVIKYNFLYKTLLNIMLYWNKYISFITFYKIMCYIMMPFKFQRQARKLFVLSAKKTLDKKEFLAWFKIINNYPKIHDFNIIKNIKIPKLYIMGENDFMFIKYVKSFVKNNCCSKFISIKKAGHVCNMDNFKEVNNILEIYFKKILN